ncbi:hypothetical protein B8b_08 [Pseudoalteromonas phage B8b]|uniref:Uncharacterized protein n=1 Tax=Pseudoalteromonas phage B8b TaxID=1506997 RepID=A0A076GC57_9CAUD|nr:hypothetical protein B8b_08 [Pseudoalteromonas phage B8b]|tara:strand:- start:511 stop:768 length:258 start_codon:yes stop_codon:yes gene_type:complete
MKDILDILMKAPISKLAEIDPKLAGLVIKAADLDNKRKGTLYRADGELDILYYHSSLAYGQRRMLDWSHERMVRDGEAEWANENE